MAHTHCIKLTIFPLLVFALLLQSCKVNSQPANSIDAIFEEQLGHHYDVQYNNSKTLVLGVQKPASDHVNRKYKFVVISLPEHKIQEKGVFEGGYARWLTDSELEIQTVKSSARNKDETEKLIIKVNANR